MLGVQSAGTESLNGVHVDHLGQVGVIPNSDLLDLVGGTETIEEVDEGDTAFDGGQVGNSAQVHNFLHVGFSQHGETGLAAGVNVGMVTEDVQSLGSHSTGRDMEHGGEQLASDLVHVGDHQQQTLGCGVGGGQSTGGQRAMNGTCSTGFRLHLNDLNGIAEDVQTTGSGPLVHIVSHGAGGGDGVDASYFGKCVANVGGSSIAVHSLEFSCQNKIPPKVFIICLLYHSTFQSICKVTMAYLSRKNMHKKPIAVWWLQWVNLIDSNSGIYSNISANQHRDQQRKRIDGRLPQ